MFDFGKSFELKDIILPKGAKPFTMLWVDPGNFIMGLIDKPPTDFEEEFSIPTDKFENTISKGFWLGQYVVTQVHWNSLSSTSIKNSPSIHSINLPIYSPSWVEAMIFCRELNIRYKSQIPKGYHFSLPTESQWEYACKAGSKIDYITLTEEDYWTMGKEKNILEVGSKKSNEWGFYDMLGNIRQMCFDISAFNPALDEAIIPISDGKVLDWIGNMNEEDWFPDLPSCYGFVRSIRGCNSSVYREFRLPYWHDSHTLIPLVGFRVCLRPITEWDLNDPLLQKEGINMLE